MYQTRNEIRLAAKMLVWGRAHSRACPERSRRVQRAKQDVRPKGSVQYERPAWKAQNKTDSMETRSAHRLMPGGIRRGAYALWSKLCHVLHHGRWRRQTRHSCFAGGNHRFADPTGAAIFRAHDSALPVENIRFDPRLLEHRGIH
jgi:hypothetical protein